MGDCSETQGGIESASHAGGGLSCGDAVVGCGDAVVSGVWCCVMLNFGLFRTLYAFVASKFRQQRDLGHTFCDVNDIGGK